MWFFPNHPSLLLQPTWLVFCERIVFCLGLTRGQGLKSFDTNVNPYSANPTESVENYSQRPHFVPYGHRTSFHYRPQEMILNSFGLLLVLLIRVISECWLLKLWKLSAIDKSKWFLPTRRGVCYPGAERIQKWPSTNCKTRSFSSSRWSKGASSWRFGRSSFEPADKKSKCRWSSHWSYLWRSLNILVLAKLLVVSCDREDTAANLLSGSEIGLVIGLLVTQVVQVWSTK